MAETRIDQRERRKITPTWVGEPQQLPNSQVKVLRLNADDGLQYETFKQSLFSYIEVGKELDADTELRISTSQDGTEYPHWRVVQIYDESGKPLASTQPKGQFRGRDEDRVDQRTFVMEVGADLRAGIKVPEELTTARRTILTSWINLSVKEKGKTPELDEETVQDIPVTNTKELMSWALKHGKEFTPTWVRQQVGAGNNVITNEQAQEYYQVIKDAMGWEN